MTSKVYRKIFSALFLIFLVLAVVFNSSMLHRRKSVNISRFQKVLYRKEALVDKVQEDLIKKIKLHDYDRINQIMFFDLPFQNYSDNGIYFAVYSYDTLCFWSDNHIVLPEVLGRGFDLNISKIGNSWYEIRRRQFGNYLVLGFIKIKDEYPYANKYLKDGFAKGFDFLPPQVNISLIPVSFGYDVKSADGQYLFSLVPSGIKQSESHTSNSGLIFFLLAVWAFFAYLAFALVQARSINIIIAFTLLVAFRLFMIIYHFPAFLYAHPFFKPLLSFYSLGDLIIDIPLVIAGLLIFCLRFEYERYRPEQNYIAFDLVYLSLVNLFSISVLYFVFDLFYELIINSGYNFELFRIYSMSIESIIIVFILGVTVASIFVFYYLMLRKVARYFTISFLLFSQVAVLVIVYLINRIFLHYSLDFTKLFYVFPLALLVYMSRSAVQQRFRFFIVISIFVSIFTTLILLISISDRNKDQLEYHATHLEYFRDHVAEQVLMDVTKKLYNDDMVNSYLSRLGNEKLNDQIARYLKLEYFSGYLKKYNIKLKVCSGSDYQICQQTYYSLLNKEAVKLSRGLYFLNIPGHLPSYLVYIEKPEAILAVELVPSMVGDQVGYPELLVNQSSKAQGLEEYKYAIYRSGKLIYKSGEFIYPSDDKFWRDLGKDKNFVRLNGFLHYLRYDKQGDYLIIVSIPQISIYDILITFSYLFFVFLIIGGTVFILVEIATSEKGLQISFRTKLMIFMIGILTGAFVIIGLTTAAITTTNYKRKFDQRVRNSLTRSRLVIEKQFLQSGNVSENDKLKFLVQDIADILNTDVNLYNQSGKLIATSRQKIYEKHLLGPYINYNALVKLLKNRFVEYIDQESIGNLTFTSAYTIVNDNNRNIRGFINIPYFANSQEMHKEILDLLVTLGNIYIVMFLFTVLIAFILSEQIILPLKELQLKLKGLKVGHKYEKIDYKRHDEIGHLVQEYNNMVEKLEESVQLLAKSERENAWRDMAKQVAHEIKNPLTPMKLSIQLLQKAWENGDTDFGDRLNEVTNTLIEQIENLRNIAEEFSNFAKMPKSENEKIDLAQKIENLVKLYENIENVEVKAIIKNRPVYIWADNKQISRALINLIKNAIQAVPEGVKGLVIVELEQLEDKALIKVMDNGTGIPEEVRHKLFTPSFTTKSSGMGLGLSMVKNIVQNAKGRIWFDTELGKGTTFYIEFPVYQGD